MLYHWFPHNQYGPTKPSQGHKWESIDDKDGMMYVLSCRARAMASGVPRVGNWVLEACMSSDRESKEMLVR